MKQLGYELFVWLCVVVFAFMGGMIASIFWVKI